MRVVSLYVNNQRVDLFNDEQINVTSSIQNVNDISKVYTDFSQTFTVPCSKNNNEIFQHYYNNDLNASYSAQNRQDARIEINNVPFRKGKLQLESAETKGNDNDNYKVTFYGDITTLKDLFATDKLSDLDYSSLLVEYDDATVTTAQSTLSDLDVRFPLISSNRIWEYGDATTADISTIPGKINYTELFPAIKAQTILDLIADKYGLTFTGLFLNDYKFKNYFTWWKNKKSPNFTNQPVQVLFNVGGVTEPLADSVEYVSYENPSTYAPATATFTSLEYYLEIKVIPDFTDTYWMDIERNGDIVNSYTINGVTGVSQTRLVHGFVNPYNTLVNGEYKVYLRSATAGGFTGSLKSIKKYTYIDGGVTTSTQSTQTANIVPFTLSNYIDFASSAPDITVSDYLTGILNHFNLTCFPLSENLTFQIEPLDKWYQYGKEWNITEYVDINSITYERVKLHKTISFEFQPSKSFMNDNFTGFFSRSYGDLNSEFAYDGGDFKIKLPFENLLFNKFTNTNLQVGYSLEKAEEGTSYIPKCTNLYMDRAQFTCDFYLGASNITTYLPFGQDTTIGSNSDYSINFGSDTSTLKDQVIDNSIYATYYQPYLVNLYNPKTRKVKIKAQFPIDVLTEISLDASVIIRDKKYRIDEMKSNLTTGEVDLVLITDLTVPKKARVVLEPVQPVGGPAVASIPIVPTNTGVEQYYVEITAPAETQFVTSTPTLPTTITSSQDFEFTVPTNTGPGRTNTIPISYYNMDGTLNSIDYFVIQQEGADNYLTGGGIQLLTNALDELTT